MEKRKREKMAGELGEKKLGEKLNDFMAEYGAVLFFVGIATYLMLANFVVYVQSIFVAALDGCRIFHRNAVIIGALVGGIGSIFMRKDHLGWPMKFFLIVIVGPLVGAFVADLVAVLYIEVAFSPGFCAPPSGLR